MLLCGKQRLFENLVARESAEFSSDATQKREAKRTRIDEGVRCQETRLQIVQRPAQWPCLKCQRMMVSTKNGGLTHDNKD
jgi:hypothetical protein